MRKSSFKALGTLLCCATIAGIAPCAAQDSRTARPVQISINLSMMLPASDAAGVEGRLAHSEATRRAFYALITRECDLLLATIASSCQLTNASVNINEQRQAQPAPYVQINASGNFAIVLKAK